MSARWCTLVLALAGAFPAVADEWPVIREITFQGNDITRPRVMLREMVIGVGDPAVPEQIERSRQGVLDLGLFRAVSVVQTPVEGGVRLTFVVHEKWYLLPIPRYEVNSEGENAYGALVRWHNVSGLNDSFGATWVRRDEKEVNKDRATSYFAGYSMPFVFDSDYSLAFGGGHSETPITDPVAYDERIDSFGVALSRSFPREARSQGWTVGTSLGWSHQSTHGPTAPPSYGQATTLSLYTNFHDVRNRIYSDEGVTYGASAASAARYAGSDYSYNQFTVYGRRYLPIGKTPHQSLHLHGSAGSYHGGPQEPTSDAGVFNLGGTGSLRGYHADFLEGDAYYYVGAAYLRPVFRDWFRFVVIAEAGNVFPDIHDSHLDKVYTSIGVGFRLRLTFLVNVDLEAGYAWPLDGGPARFFASKV